MQGIELVKTSGIYITINQYKKGGGVAISLQVTDIYTYRLAHLVISNGYLIAVSYSETLGLKLTASITLLPVQV